MKDPHLLFSFNFVDQFTFCNTNIFDGVAYLELHLKKMIASTLNEWKFHNDKNVNRYPSEERLKVRNPAITL